jgi:hypothetical protein
MIIRNQMEITRRRMSQKLDMLEEHVLDTVHSAGSTVNATAETVQDVVQSVGRAFDVEQHYRRHPWLFIGGSIALGYVLTELLSEGASRVSPSVAAKNSERCDCNGDSRSPSTEHPASTDGSVVSGHPGSLETALNGKPRSNGNSPGYGIRRASIEAFAGFVREIATRSLPLVMDYFLHAPSAQGRNEERQSDSRSPENI